MHNFSHFIDDVVNKLILGGEYKIKVSSNLRSDRRDPELQEGSRTYSINGINKKLSMEYKEPEIHTDKGVSEEEDSRNARDYFIDELSKRLRDNDQVRLRADREGGRFLLTNPDFSTCYEIKKSACGCVGSPPKGEYTLL